MYSMYTQHGHKYAVYEAMQCMKRRHAVNKIKIKFFIKVYTSAVYVGLS